MSEPSGETAALIRARAGRLYEFQDAPVFVETQTTPFVPPTAVPKLTIVVPPADMATAVICKSGMLVDKIVIWADTEVQAAAPVITTHRRSARIPSLLPNFDVCK
jgi:hypothetical protein